MPQLLLPIIRYWQANTFLMCQATLFTYRRSLVLYALCPIHKVRHIYTWSKTRPKSKRETQLACL